MKEKETTRRSCGPCGHADQCARPSRGRFCVADDLEDHRYPTNEPMESEAVMQPPRLSADWRMPRPARGPNLTKQKPPPTVAPPEPHEVRRAYGSGVVMGWVLACDCVAAYGITAARGHQVSLERWLSEGSREGVPMPEEY